MDLWAQCGPMKSILDQFDRLYAFGRDALYWGLREYASGEASCVWMPSYHCGVEVQAALDAGFEVCFYRVRSDLTIDESDLEAKVSVRPGHVMVIHYMGFVQPGSRRIASLCARLGVMLIEDCTHALLSSFDGERAGCLGHFAIYSLYKTLCVCDGGALKLNRTISGLPQKRGGYSLPLGHPSFYGYRLQINAIIQNLIGDELARAMRLWLKRRRHGSSNPLGDGYAKAPDPSRMTERKHRRGMSALSRRLASRMDPAKILSHRRDNWMFLDRRLSKFEGYHKVMPELQHGVCPLFLPIWVSQRDALVAKLECHNIETFVFGAEAHPAMVAEDFPETHTLRNNILCLPVHQYLRESQMMHLTSVLGLLLGEHDAMQDPAFDCLECLLQ